MGSEPTITPDGHQAVALGATNDVAPVEQTVKRLLELVTLPLATITISVLGSVLFAIRCLAVTDWNPAPAREVFLHSTLSAALQALGFVAMPAISLVVAVVLAFLAGESWKDRGFNKRVLIYAGLGLIVNFLAFDLVGVQGGWGLDAIVFGSLIAGVVVGVVASILLRRTGRLVLLGAMMCIAISGLLLPEDRPQSPLSDRVWLTKEKFQLVDGTSRDVYVLDVRGDDYFVLGHDSRTVYLISATEVAAKSVCYATNGTPALPSPSTVCQERPALTEKPTASPSPSKR